MPVYLTCGCTNTKLDCGTVQCGEISGLLTHQKYSIIPPFNPVHITKPQKLFESTINLKLFQFKEMSLHIHTRINYKTYYVRCMLHCTCIADKFHCSYNTAYSLDRLMIKIQTNNINELLHKQVSQLRNQRPSQKNVTEGHNSRPGF